MRKPRWIIGLLLLVTTVPACVELTGQRLTWSYDPAKDEIVVLLHYDGIHDSGGDSSGKGVRQIPEFVAGGNVMLLDWIGHLDMAQLRARAEDPATKPLERDCAKLLTTFRAEAIGHYREPDGRIGALQRITVPRASDFVRKANELINRSILEQSGEGTNPVDRRVRKAAETRHAWFRLDGNAIRVAVPVPPDQWAMLKAEALRQAGQWAAKMLDDKTDAKERRNFPAAVQALTAAPLSYLEDGDRVEIVLGRKKTPSTLRFSSRDEYEPSLEKVTAETVRLDLDRAIADALLEPKAKAPDAVRELLAWGPPEDRARALVAAVQSGPAGRKEAAVKQLAALAQGWNQAGRLPEAPRQTSGNEKSLAEWKAWYAEMRRFPLGKEATAEEKRGSSD
jgi:hypothetical protein